MLQPAQQRLPPAPHVQYVYTRLQLANGQLPPSEWGRLLAHSYSEHGNWYVMMVLDAYQMAGTGQFAGTNHFSPWNYDRHVPLAFYGAPFVPGEYHERVAPVDLAVTFASLAGVNRPSAAVGRVLTEAIEADATSRVPADHCSSSCRKEDCRQVKPDMRVTLAGIELANPIIAASGTFGYGIEFEEIVSLERIGGFVTKGISLQPMAGHPAPRIIQTAAGMLNAIGLQNVGVEEYMEPQAAADEALSAMQGNC